MAMNEQLCLETVFTLGKSAMAESARFELATTESNIFF